MKKFVLLLALAVSAQDSLGEDGISGVPEADFSVRELRIPCVRVKNLDPSVDNQYFDVTLSIDDSLVDYQLKFVQVEDPAYCQTVDGFARFEDDDFGDDDSANPTGSAAKILVRCEVRSNRSKVSVDGNSLPGSSYSAVVVSGSNEAQSPVKATVGDEVEFDFDSDPGDIAAGATAIAAGFIQGGAVSARILDAQGNEVVSADPVACLRK